MTPKSDSNNSKSDSEISSCDSDYDDKSSKSKTTIRRKCKYCGKKFQNVNKRDSHEKSCEHIRQVEFCVGPDGRTKFLCKICWQSFKYMTGLTRHEKRHEPPGGFICKICGTLFTTDFDRNNHKDAVHRTYKCQICETKFSTNNEYVEHIQSAHDGRDREYVVCSDCGQQFKTAIQLKHHNDSKCGTQKSFACDICGSKFMTQNTLNAHKMIHLGEKKHLCNYCGNSFLSKGQLKVHERSHTKEKPFKCNICNKAFSYRESLVTHSSLHTGIKPYLCEGCGSRFSCIGNLIKHRRARPDTCGLPQFCKNTKIAPRASAKNPGSLTMKVPKSQLKVLRGPYKKKKQNRKNDQMIEKGHSKKQSTDDQSETSDSNLEDVSNRKNNLHDSSEEQKTYIVNFETFDGNMDLVEGSLDDSKLIVERVEQQQSLNSLPTYTTEYIEQVDYTGYNASNTGTFVENWTNDSTVYEVQTYEPTDCYSNYEDNTVSEIKSDAKDVNLLSSNAQNMSLNVNEIDIKSEDEYDEIILNENTPLSEVKKQITKGRREKYRKSRKIRTNNTEILYTDSQNFDNYIVNPECNKLSKKNENQSFYITELSVVPLGKIKAFEIINAPEEYPSTSNHINLFQDNSNDFIEEHVKDEYNDDDDDDNDNDDDNDLQYSDSDFLENTKEIDIKDHDTMETAKYKCHICPKIYISKTVLQKHLKNIHNCVNNDLLIIESSNQKINDDVNKQIQQSSKKKRRSDNNKKQKEQLYKCKYCDKKYASLGLATKHESVHGPDGLLTVKCSCCKTYFTSQQEADKHQIENHQDKLVCNECSKIFKEPDSLIAHMKNSHSREATNQKKYIYVCPKCGKKFSSKVALSDHERSDCGRAPLYKCDVCEKCYHSAGSLKTHQTIHSGELPHLCNYCGKAFRTQGQVKVHERRHNGDKPFKCEYCSKSFAYRESLLTHRSLHTGMKRFMCQACGSRFSCISNLQAHRKSHKNTCGLQPKMTKPVGPMGLFENNMFLP